MYVLMGLLGSCGLVLGLAFLNPGLHSPEQVEKELNACVVERTTINDQFLRLQEDTADVIQTKNDLEQAQAQVADLADAVAYNNHDVDDGFRAGLLTLEQLREKPLFARQFDAVRERYPDLDDRRLIYEIIRRMIGTVVADHPGVVVAQTGIGGTRVVDLPLGEQLPRIC